MNTIPHRFGSNSISGLNLNSDENQRAAITLLSGIVILSNTTIQYTQYSADEHYKFHQFTIYTTQGLLGEELAPPL